MRKPSHILAWLALVAGCGAEPPTITERLALKGHTREIVSIAVAPDGKTLASRGADGVKVWSLPGGDPVLTLPPDGSDFGSVAYSPDGRTLAANRVGLGAIAWAIPGGAERTTYLFPGGQPTALTGLMSPGWGLAYSPDGKILAGGASHGGEDGFLMLWSTLDGKEVGVRPKTLRPITSVSYARDGRMIATGSMDGAIDLWDVATGRPPLKIAAKRSYLAPVAISPDGKLVASANEARWIKFWNVATGKEVGVLKGHLKAVLSLAFTPDGKALASGDSGGTLYVWDVEGRSMRTRLPSDRGKVWGLAFGPDGRTLYSAGEDKLIHAWNVAWPAP